MAALGVLPTVCLHDPSVGVSALRPTGVAHTVAAFSFDKVRLPPVWRTASASSWTAGTGQLAGTVSENAAVIERCVVRLYCRSSGALIATALTSPQGLFSFDELESADAENYFVVAFDPASGVPYNALIFDRLTPVG
jgi:hypothetical protein